MFNQNENDKITAIRYSIKLNRANDKDIIDKLNEVSSKQGYIKSLIREDIQKQKA